MEKGNPDRHREAMTTSGNSTDRTERLFDYLNSLNLIVTPNTKTEIEEFVDLFDVVEGDSILIVGDTGVGKTLFLRVFEFLYKIKHGERKIPEVNCSHLNPALSASILFGHMKGAFTGAVKETSGFISANNHGPIILEEIGVLPQEVQAQLLTVMESGEFYKVGGSKALTANIQIIGATNDETDLRKDFMYRFHPFYIRPFYQRRDDVLRFIWHSDPDFFRSLYASEILILLSYNWPGNVREIRRVARFLKLVRKWANRDSTPDLFRYHDMRISKISYSWRLFYTFHANNININPLERFLNKYHLGIVPPMHKKTLPFRNVRSDEEAAKVIETAKDGLLLFADLFLVDPYSNSDISDIWNSRCDHRIQIYNNHKFWLPFSSHELRAAIPKGLREWVWIYIRPKLENRPVNYTSEAEVSDLDNRPSAGSRISPELPDMFSMTLEELKRAYFSEILKRAGGVQRKAAELAGVNAKTFSAWCRKRKIP
jgi:energy-coupling factor transporter ATP-binding protein EcfA2